MKNDPDSARVEKARCETAKNGLGLETAGDDLGRRESPKNGLGRRDMMKLSAGAAAGAVMTQMLHPQIAAAQQGQAAQNGAMQPAVWTAQERYAGVKMESGPGWKNTSGRASGNGPMDETSRRLVEYTASFSEANVDDKLASAFANTMVDTIASLISGFESEPARISARMARANRSDLKSTVLGYGIVTTPEYAAYANTSMIRHTDYNDHISDMMGGILAVGEALHSTGAQVMAAIILAYQIQAALSGAGGNSAGFDAGLYYTPAAALATGKLLKLNQDQLANALSMAVSMHIPLRVDRSNTLSMQKGCSTADAARTSTFCALAAAEGITGAARPFEGRDGLWDKLTGPYRQLRLPPAAEPGVALTNTIKRRAAEGYTQAMHEVIIPQVRAWTKAEDIAAIRIEMTYSGWLEIADPPKWDPLNRETADHSMPYEVARALLDGDVYVDSFTKEKFMDPAARALMEKITVAVEPSYPYQGQVRMTVQKKDGSQLVKETSNPTGQFQFGTPMTHEEIWAKYNRICAFMHVDNDQRDRALAQWSNLRAVKDIAEPMQTLAKFGRPQPL